MTYFVQSRTNMKINLHFSTLFFSLIISFDLCDFSCQSLHRPRPLPPDPLSPGVSHCLLICVFFLSLVKSLYFPKSVWLSSRLFLRVFLHKYFCKRSQLTAIAFIVNLLIYFTSELVLGFCLPAPCYFTFLCTQPDIKF